MLSFSSPQLTKVTHLSAVKIVPNNVKNSKSKTFSLQVTIYDSVKFMDYLKIQSRYLNFNILEVVTRNGTLIAIS